MQQTMEENTTDQQVDDAWVMDFIRLARLHKVAFSVSTLGVITTVYGDRGMEERDYFGGLNLMLGSEEAYRWLEGFVNGEL